MIDSKTSLFCRSPPGNHTAMSTKTGVDEFIHLLWDLTEHGWGRLPSFQLQLVRRDVIGLVDDRRMANRGPLSLYQLFVHQGKRRGGVSFPPIKAWLAGYDTFSTSTVRV